VFWKELQLSTQVQMVSGVHEHLKMSSMQETFVNVFSKIAVVLEILENINVDGMQINNIFTCNNFIHVFIS